MVVQKQSRTRCGIAVLVAILLRAAGALGTECGPDVACKCGDTLRVAVTLESDLVDCPGMGLRLKTGAVLDCDGHAVIGTGSKEGIVLDESRGAAVQNCLISGFDRGLRVRRGAENRILDNEIFANDEYGIDLAGGTTGNRIEGNLVRDNRDEGIHVGTAAHRNEIVANQILRNKRENLYVLASDGSVVMDNLIEGGGAAAIYVKHARNSVFARNLVRDRAIQVRGESLDNLFVANHLEGAGFIFQAYEDAKLGWTFPHHNWIVTGSIRRAETCFRFSGAYDNRASVIEAAGCTRMKTSSLGGCEATGNVVELIASD